jgi:amino acid adenylation domain-containing protein
MSEVDLAARRSLLSPAKRALLAERLRSVAAAAPRAVIRGQPAAAGPAPLSLAQQRLWFLQQLSPASAAYNCWAALDLEGDLDLRSLAAGCAEIVRRHEVLRSVVRLVDGEPMQEVAAAVPAGLPLVDLATLPAPAAAAEVDRLSRVEVRRPFDLARGPLLRPRVFRRRRGRHLLLLCLHHLVWDGWSMQVFFGELAQLYRAARAGVPAALPELPVQYSDFARWQRRQMAGRRHEEEVAYWREQLAGAPPLLELPLDRARPAAESQRGAVIPLAFDAALGERLRTTGRRHGATLAMTLLAAYAALLSRWSRQRDVVVGMPTAGRSHVEIEGLIGFFVNTLAVRVELAGDPRFADLLAAVRETALEAQRHQEVPFERLVEELAPRRSLAHTPIFQVMFSLQPVVRQELAVADLRLRPAAVEGGSAKFDLDLELLEGVDGLLGGLEYRCDLFDRSTVRRLAGNLDRLLREVAEDSARRVAELQLLSGAERQQVVIEWNATAERYGRARALHELVEEQARRSPDAVAVAAPGALPAAGVGDGEMLRYGALNARANRVARRLRALGVGPESVVAIGMERSCALVVGLLAILKAGGAYLPLDPGYPEERLRFMREDAGASVLVTESALTGRPGWSGSGVLCLDDPEGPWQEEPGTDLGVEVEASHPAYVLYTSGSTGRPKGAVISHGAIVNHMRWMQRELPLAADDRVLQKTSVSFDASVWEFYAPLLVGGCLVMAPPGAQREPAALAKVLASGSVTVLQVVPSLLRALLAEPGFVAACGGLRRLYCGGEALSPSLRDQTLAALPGVELVNVYGPTETTIHASWRRFRAAEPGAAAAVAPIGRPIGNGRVYVVDDELRPVPIGVSGELLVGGAGLGRGYLGRPAATAERWVPDPFAPRPGERLYRTGDRARWSSAGELEFLGRLDHQVKIRGFRVELGEIEAALGTHPGVAAAAAVVREEAPGDQRLVAYFVARGEGEAAPSAPAVAELRGWLAARLPGAMVPQAFVEVAALPLTANGKLDRAALASRPAPRGAGSPGSGARAGDGEDLPAPRGPIEALLVAVWEEVLGVEGLGARDSFFDLGGHSLLAVQMVSRVRAQLGLEMELRDLFEAPTVEQLARRIAGRQGALAAAPPPLVAQPRDGRQARWPLSFAQQRLWFLDQLRPGSNAYNLPVRLRIGGRLDRAALRHSLQAVVARHEALRTRFAYDEGEAAQVVEPAAELALPLLDLGALPATARQAELDRLAASAAARPFDLQRGPLLRALLVALGQGVEAAASPSGHVLLATMHHIVSDGWSMAIFAREATALYAAHAGHGRSAPPALPALPVQYADYAVWQRAWLCGEVLEKELAYWRRRLAGAPAVLALPTDRPRRPVAGEGGGSRRRTLSAPSTHEVRVFGRRHGATLFMTLLAGFAGLLSRYSGELDLCIGTPVAGRDRLEIEGLIGFFVNILVLRADLEGRPDFAALLARLRHTVLDAHLHQALPFEKLVDEAGVERSASHSPLFQVVLVVETERHAGAGTGPEESPGAASGDSGSVKFDLTLEAHESAGGLALRVSYRGELFDGATMERFLGHYQRLLAAALRAPGLPVEGLPLLDPAERHQLTTEWGDAAADGAEDAEEDAGACLHTLFARQAERAPAAIAVVDCGRSLSYGELDRRADALAAELARRGVRPGDLVALCLERSLETVVAILGTLKAGAAYLPLEVTLPRERLRFLLGDARPRLVVADAAGRAALPAAASTVVAIGEPHQERAAVSARRPAQTAVTPAWPAYVMYTSGSTGRPKGVAVGHRHVARLFRATRARFAFGAADVWTLFHSYAFDFSVWELWGALLHGGRLVIVPYVVSRSPEAFHQLLAEAGVTVLNQTPTAFRELQRAAAERPAAALALRLVIFGGEALEPEWLRRWFELHGDEHPRLVNMYGITETTVHVTWRRLSRADLGAGGSPIGRPIADLAVLVLDAAGEPAAIGVPGEIQVAGAGLSPGYLGRPELTAARFVPHPFARRPGERIYRSGDLGRYRADGQIEYLGRIDQQVKIRGFRIELGEIEAALLALPAVRDAVVRVRSGAAEDKRLVAWVVAAPGARIEPAELRHTLAAALPGYMVPAAFVPLAQLPLTVNGKLDSAALPDPGAVFEAGERRPAAGDEGAGDGLDGVQGAAETLLAAAVSEVLRVPAVRMSDNFFSLGGDSISAIRLRARAAAAGLEVALQDIFRYPSLGELARAAGAAGETPPVALEPFALLAPADRARLPADLEDAYPLARLQAGMVFHGELGGAGVRPYHNVASVRLSAPYDPAAVRRALRELTRRHPVLRTRFAMAGFSEALQLVERAARPRLRICDLRALPEAAQRAALEERFAAHQGQPFDLAQAPLLRCELLPLAPGRFELLWAEHHAILDGWSVATMMAELFQLYRSELGEAAPPPPPPAGNLLRDFVALERSALAADASRELWRGRLAQRPAGRLPRWPRGAATDRRTGGRLHRGFEIDRRIAQRLRETARGDGLPLKSALLAAHLAVLSRLCGATDVITGLVSNGRPEVAGGDRALGLFLNTVPLRLRLCRGSWRERVRQVFAEELALLPHRRYPLAELQRELGGGEELFETSFNYVHFHTLSGVASQAPVALEGWREVAEVHFVCSASFGVDPFRGALHLDLTFAAAEIAAAEAAQIGELYRRALAALAEQPEGDAAAALLLSGAERQQVVIEWNATAERYGRARALHELVEEQARRSPDAVAVAAPGALPAAGVGDGEMLRYGALNARANRVARRLRALGVGPESVVAIGMERSCALVVGLLAILKAGGAYLPLDPGYPEERLRFMREDAGASVLVTESALTGRPGWSGSGVLCLDDPEGPWQEEPGTDLGVEVEASHPAYVLYTSGSTGRPKGAVISHGAIVNHMRWMQRELPLAADDRVLQKTSVSFDASVWEFYAPLLVGGCLVMAPPGAQREPAALAKVLASGSVTVLQVVPSLLRALLAEPGFVAACGGLRRLYCGGEALSPSLRDQTLAALPGVELVNVYGPTETTIHASWRRFRAAEPGAAAAVAPIGRPIGNGRVYVVDDELRPVPIGVSGELLVGGAGLGRGYLGRPAATAERWVPDPFAPRPGERLYRTGDRARWSSAGELEFLGRLDHQVKIRGFRVELGEIEAALEELPAVREAVVRLRPDARGEPRLVAWLVAAEGAAPVAAELRGALAVKLPEHMVPAAFVTLSRLPWTPNGKLDTAALPEPGRPGSGGRAGPVIAPRDGVELELTRLWEDLLGLAEVRSDESFFELGGHSLAALRLMARIRSRFGRELPLTALFQRPTIEGLAELVRQGWVSPPSRLVPIEVEAGGRPWFCVHPVGGAVLCYAELGRCLRGRRSLYGLEAEAADAALGDTTVAEMAAGYLRETRAVQATGPYLLAGWSMGGLVALEMAQQLAARGEAVELLALVDPTTPVGRPPAGQPGAAATVWHFARDLAQLLGADPAALAAGYAASPAGESADAAGILERMYRSLRGARLLPPDLALPDLRRRLRVFERNLRAGGTYEPRPYAGRLTLLMAGEPAAPAAALAVWQGLAAGEWSVQSFPGGHYDLLRQPLVAEVASALERLVARPGQGG